MAQGPAWQAATTRVTAAAVLPDHLQPPVDPVAVNTLAPALDGLPPGPADDLARHRAAVVADARVHAGRTAAAPTPWSGVLGAPSSARTTG